MLKDLCARLSYGVKVAFFNEDLTYHSEPKTLTGIECINSLNYSSLEDEDGNTTIVEFCRPYLFPLSSMTEEQALELYKLFGINLIDSAGADYIKINEVTGITFFLRKGFDVETHLDKLIDWLLKNHFDFRGLIPMGHALDATGLNIY